MAAPTVVIGGTTYELPEGEGGANKVQWYNAVIIAIVALLTGNIAWINVTFTNSWVNFGGSSQDVQYRKLGDIVYMRGAGKTGTINTSAFTLPSGYRPPANISFAEASNGAFGQLTVNSDGTVVPAVGSNVYFHFQGSFSVTA